ncbi:MAG: filamentous hemagglutinin N-terminal domain-containing protein, partial [Cyanobacteria bacterium P01_G01_bin.19]
MFHTAAVLASLLGCQNYTRAQISSDGTVSTEVNNSGNDSTIEGGTAQGSNLFHSFQEFSVPTGNTAYFNNAAEIENIIGRVTGNSSSTIDGLLRANGNANLILLNPNGIDFGDNTRLDIGGSFLGSTAESLIFEDGTIFDARDPSVSPLLTVSTPVGLQLGQNSGAIDVGGVGHDLGVEVPVFSPFSRGEVSGLELESGNTLGLVGNGLSFTGGVVVSETGRVELGSVAEGIVDINWNEQSFFLSYQEITAFRDIELNERSLIDTSGNNSGSVNIQGSQVTIADASVVLVQNQGAENSGNLTVNATSSFSLSDISEDRVVASGIYTEALGSGKGGNINVTTPNLSITDGASIFADSFGSAASGDININVSDSIEIIGFAANDPRKFSIITAQVFSTGDAGTITINTNSLTALNGGNVASVTGNQNATGSGGDVIINAGESILLSGVTPITAPSQITAGSGSAGNAGNVQLNTKVLTLENGGRVDASATASGNAGNVNINATESIMVTGTVPDSLNPSLIIASANILDLELRELFNLPPIPSGNSGSVTISTPQLQIMDGGQVTVRNDGTGNAGNLKITADSINLASNGGITAAVESGEGGTINLEVANAINLTGGSQIASDNNGVGDGGEIAIAASSLSISDSSFITTTTFGAGQGGDIMLSLTDSLNITGT